MNDEILERIDLKIAYLEKANIELSDVVYRQQQQLDALSNKLSILAGAYEELKQEPRESMEEERPPHY